MIMQLAISINIAISIIE